MIYWDRAGAATITHSSVLLLTAGDVLPAHHTGFHSCQGDTEGELIPPALGMHPGAAGLGITFYLHKNNISPECWRGNPLFPNFKPCPWQRCRSNH